MFLCSSMVVFAQPRKFKYDTDAPKVVSVNEKGIPSDAIILLSDTVNEFVDRRGKPISWTYEDGIMTVTPRGKGSTEDKNVYTKQSFGDCQLHLEFRTPIDHEGKGKKNGNSGIYLQLSLIHI